MKKHLLVTLCVGSLLALPGCMGCCDRTKKEEAVTTTEVDATQVSVTPEAGAQPMDAMPTDAGAEQSAAETNKF